MKTVIKAYRYSSGPRDTITIEPRHSRDGHWIEIDDRSQGAVGTYMTDKQARKLINALQEAVGDRPNNAPPAP